MKTIITLPIESRAEAHRFYVDAFDLETVGEPADDGIVEPLQFKLGDGVTLMFIPRGGLMGARRAAGSRNRTQRVPAAVLMR